MLCFSIMLQELVEAILKLASIQLWRCKWVLLGHCRNRHYRTFVLGVLAKSSGLKVLTNCYSGITTGVVTNAIKVSFFVSCVLDDGSLLIVRLPEQVP